MVLHLGALGTQGNVHFSGILLHQMNSRWKQLRWSDEIVRRLSGDVKKRLGPGEASWRCHNIPASP